MDPVLRIVTITLLLTLSCGLLLNPRRKTSHLWHWSLCFAGLAIGTSAFVADNAVTTLLTPSGFWVMPVTFFAKMTVLFVWWLGQCSFSDRFRFDFMRLSIGALWVSIIMLDMWRVQNGLEGPIDYLGIILATALMIHLVWFIVAGRPDDLRKTRRDVRLWLPAIVIAFVLADLTVDFAFGFNWRPSTMILLQNACLCALAVTLVIITLHGNFKQFAVGSNATSLEGEAVKRSHNAKRIDALMHDQKLFLVPSLRLSDLVSRLPLSEAKTRSIIHDEFGCEHFRTFLNRYRVDHAKTLMQKPEHVNEKLIGIALDSGFASLASFQRAFKREVGQAPSIWRKNI